MANPIVQRIHAGHYAWWKGVLGISGDLMRYSGNVMASTGYAFSASGIGIELGVPLAALGNGIKFTGIGISLISDFWVNDRQTKGGYDAIVGLPMGIVGALGNMAPGPNGAIFNMTLIPVNAAIDYGSFTIKN